MEAKFKPRQQEIESCSPIAGHPAALQAGAGKLTQQAEADLTAQGQRKQRDLQRMSDDLQADVTADRNEVLGKSSQRCPKW